MKKIVLSILICLSISSISSFADAAIAVNNKKDAGFISLSGSTSKEVEPNIARIDFAIENTGSDAQSATSNNNTISNKIMNALKEISVQGSDVITTTNFSVRPVYQTIAGKRTIQNYILQLLKCL